MKLLLVLLFMSFLSACGSSSSESIDEENRVGSLPQEVIHPSDNPTSEDKVELGRMLFWDPILSGNRDVACATCHHPNHGYAENRDLSLGVGGVGLAENRDSGTLVKRNSPTIINTAFNGISASGFYDPKNTVMFWDNRSESLEAQALGPILSKEEMRGDVYSEDDALMIVSQRLSEIPEYQTMFTDAFGDTAINSDRIAKAIAAFERTIIATNSPFDRYARGDDSALKAQELRGLTAFNDAGCNGCHNGPMFSDYELHNLGVSNNPKLTEVDRGVDGAFRTPSLRNVELTAPYMHNGTELELESAIAFYEDVSNPANDPDVAAINLEEDDPETIAAIAAFLRTLTDSSFDKTIPASVPSGLNPGGNI